MKNSSQFLMIHKWIWTVLFIFHPRTNGFSAFVQPQSHHLVRRSMDTMECRYFTSSAGEKRRRRQLTSRTGPLVLLLSIESEHRESSTTENAKDAEHVTMARLLKQFAQRHTSGSFRKNSRNGEMDDEMDTHGIITPTSHRRSMINAGIVGLISTFLSPPSFLTPTVEAKTLRMSNGGSMMDISDPQTYQALLYTPPRIAVATSSEEEPAQKLPLLIVLHGAGKNELDVWNLANPQGEHAGLPPSLLASSKAPPELSDNFIVLTPYSAGKRSFYEEPRGKILQFIQWVRTSSIIAPNIDSNRIFLLGFSDGATLGIELMTTRKFAGGVFAAYGFTGTLPALALERLQGLPIWVFHSADDVIFPVGCSDRLLELLRKANGTGGDVVRYTRYDRDQEGFTGSVRGHSTGITASKLPDIYKWMLSI